MADISITPLAPRAFQVEVREGQRETTHQVTVPERLGEQGQMDWSRASVDTMSVRGGGQVGANPVDRGKPGSNRRGASWDVEDHGLEQGEGLTSLAYYA